MTDVDFYVESIRARAVLGLEVEATPNQFESVLGRDYVDDMRRRTMRRDYGLVEIHFERRGESWTGFGVSLQAHRVTAENANEVVPPAIRSAFGRFGDPPSMADISAGLASKGISLALAIEEGDFARYVMPNSGVNVFADCSLGEAAQWLWSVQI